MLTTTVSDCEVPQELLREAIDIVAARHDRGVGSDFDRLLREAMHTLVVRACWEYFRHRKDMR